MTTAVKKMNMPTHVFIGASESDLKYDSVVLCENPSCVSKEKLGKFITKLSDTQMTKIAIASLLATSAISYIDESLFNDIREKSLKLNALKKSA